MASWAAVGTGQGMRADGLGEVVGCAGDGVEADAAGASAGVVLSRGMGGVDGGGCGVEVDGVVEATAALLTSSKWTCSNSLLPAEDLGVVSLLVMLF